MGQKGFEQKWLFCHSVFKVNAQKSMVVNKVATLLFWMMMMATDGCYMSEILPPSPPTALFVATFLLHAFTEKVEDIFIFFIFDIYCYTTK